MQLAFACAFDTWINVVVDVPFGELQVQVLSFLQEAIDNPARAVNKRTFFMMYLL
jgi:hypothetical protein